MKNADFRGGAICRTRKGATACVEVPSSVPGPSGTGFFLFRTHFLGFSWGFHGVFMGFSWGLTVSAVSGASPHRQARRSSYPLRAAFSSPVLLTSAAPIHLVWGRLVRLACP